MSICELLGRQNISWASTPQTPKNSVHKVTQALISLASYASL